MSTSNNQNTDAADQLRAMARDAATVMTVSAESAVKQLADGVTGLPEHVEKSASAVQAILKDDILYGEANPINPSDLVGRSPLSVLYDQSDLREPGPIRSFEGDAQPHEPFWRFVNAADSESGQAELEFYGVISQYSWFEDDITPRMFKDQLYAAGKGGPVLMKMDSPGGDVFSASVIRGILMDYPGEVTAKIEGIAASAAVTVTMGADKVQIMDSAYMMIHDPFFAVFLAYLTPEFLDRLTRALNQIKDGLLGMYSERTGLSEEDLSQMMADETWMSAKQAKRLGFADEIISGGAKNAQIENSAFLNCLHNYAHVPPAILHAYTSMAEKPKASSGDEEELTALRQRVGQILAKEQN